ncbi:response regulator [Natronohydrobacter thiooxidans]|uniref:response regulator n=1 Tax=Natronohydrobacter thiooxidans TaxID=87172 RepID=UPI0008FF1702|nr:response regulator transcription factor [Natronohydrobacter thiooxidans]
MNGNISGVGRTALVADDDEFFRIALGNVLCDRLGFSNVVFASSFDEAVEETSGCREIEVALVDLNMPGTDNWQSLRTIRKCFPEIRVAVVTGSRDRNDILTALSIGMQGYINKGLGVSELARAIRLICRGDVYLPPFFPELAITDNSTAHPPGSEEPPQTLVGCCPSGMTPRQHEVLKLLIEGKSNKAMARILGLSEGTIKFHLSAVFRVLGACNRVEAATAGARLLDREIL